MSCSKEFIELDKSIHDRDSFNCVEAELNEFIRTKAAKHMDIGISRTMLLPALVPLPNGKYPICAFYTIAPSSIGRETLPEKLVKKLPHYPVPVLLLAQLAVHSEYQGQGLGKTTLIKALEHLWEINSHMRAYAVIVDCLNENARQFYLKYGFEVLCSYNGKVRMFLPMNIVGQLFQ
jgi:GNAT superfamily N-acetyltransferase